MEIIQKQHYDPQYGLSRLCLCQGGKLAELLISPIYHACFRAELQIHTAS